MTDTATQRAFVLHMGEGRLAAGRERNLVGIGWGRVKNLPEIKDWEAFKQAIAEAYSEYYPDGPEMVGRAAGSPWRFIHEMKPGDWVLVPEDADVHVYRVKGEAEFSAELHEQHDMGWVRKAELEKTLARIGLSAPLQARLKARQTCVDATDLLEDIKKARNGKVWKFSSETRQGARKAVEKALKEALTPHDLEVLVMELLRKDGLEVRRRDPRGQGDADVDVEATLRIASQEVKIGFQVKKHEDKTGQHGVEQIAKAVEKGDVDVGFLVTTAEELDEDAKKKVKAGKEGKEGEKGEEKESKQNLRIRVICKDELVDWILDRGLGGISV